MNTINYTTYEMVPWHRKNWFAIVLAFVFAPALLAVLLTGDVYYIRKSELKKYTKPAKITLIIWSVFVTFQLVSAVENGGMASLKGLFQSSESSFMQSMDGRWSQGGDTVELSSVAGKMIMLDQSGSVTLITPSGKFDAGSRLMPIKAIYYKQYKDKQDVLTEVATRICHDFVSQSEMTSNVLSAYGVTPDKAKFVAAANCFHDLSENNKLSELLQTVKETMHNGIQSNLVLFNAAAVQDAVNLGIKKEDGRVIANFGFIRQTTPEEGKKISAYPAMLVSRAAMIDGAIDEIPAIVKKINDANAKTASDAAAAEKKQVDDANKPVLMQ